MRQNKNKFGLFIRELRIKKNIGQRDLAKKIGVSPSYLNDIEKEKRLLEFRDVFFKERLDNQ